MAQGKGHSFDSNGPVIGGVSQAADASQTGFNSSFDPMNQTGGATAEKLRPAPKGKHYERSTGKPGRVHVADPDTNEIYDLVNDPVVKAAPATPVTTSTETETNEPVTSLDTTKSAPLDVTPWWKRPGSKATPQQIHDLDSAAAAPAKERKKGNGLGKFDDE